MYSHTSAASMHGLHLWNVDDLVHMTQPGKPSRAGCGKDTAVHVCTLAPEDIVDLNGSKVTSLERTAVDCALTLPYKQALIIADLALRLGASMSKLLAAADTLRKHRGIRTLRKVLRFADPRSESPGETLTRDLLRELLIEMPELQVPIVTRVGQYRADFAWVRHKVVLEFDGKASTSAIAPRMRPYSGNANGRRHSWRRVGLSCASSGRTCSTRQRSRAGFSEHWPADPGAGRMTPSLTEECPRRRCATSPTRRSIRLGEPGRQAVQGSVSLGEWRQRPRLKAWAARAGGGRQRAPPQWPPRSGKPGSAGRTRRTIPGSPRRAPVARCP